MKNKIIEYEEVLEYVYWLFKDKTDKGGHPYLFHLVRVSKGCIGNNAKIIALLHDVLEDTDKTHMFLVNKYGNYIADSVSILTKKDNEKYSQYIGRIIDSKNLDCIQVKMNDLLDNMNLERLKSITKADIDRINKYKKAYRRLCEACDKL